MSRKAPKQKNKKAKARRPGRRKVSKVQKFMPWLVLTLLLLLVLGPLTLFIIIDQRVADSINSASSSSTPAIYAAPLEIRSGKKLRPALLESELVKRNYRDTTPEVEQPGEFAIDGNTVTIYLKAYSDGFGLTYPERLVHYNALSGAISDKDDVQIESFSLAPRIISHLGDGDRKVSRYKALAKIPDNLKKAIVAVEDQRFYSHLGLDINGIIRAIIANVKAGRIVQGGSTLTQQLAKNLLFSPRRTLWRKVKEAIAAFSLELRLSKDEILEHYLNSVFLGQEGSIAVHGVSSAAQFFFDKDIENISLAEAALLAGMVKAPSLYSPRRNPKAAQRRRNAVLRIMAREGVISNEIALKTIAEALKISRKRKFIRSAPFFTPAVQSAVSEDINLNAAILSGVRIYTGIDLNLQSCAKKAVEEGVAKLIKSRRNLNKDLEASLVAINPRSGLIKAWVGGKNYYQSQFDRVAQARRQIGSTVKPLVYLTALDSTLNTYRVATARTILPDKPFKLELVNQKDWEPQNYDRRFRGNVTLRYALERSLNIPAAYVGQRVGIPAISNTVKLFRLDDNPPQVPALTLGALDSSLLNLTAAYATLANGGIYVKPRLFISAVSKSGTLLTESTIYEERVAEAAPVYVLTNILQGVIDRGTGKVIKRLGFTEPAAGKTGTSNDTRDAWFVGFTPELSVGVWVGYDKAQPTSLSGASGAAPIWASFMQCAGERLAFSNFKAPTDIVFQKIDLESGEKATRKCPPNTIVEEVFVSGTEPQRLCHLHSPTRTGAYPAASAKPRDKASPSGRRRGLWEMIFGN